MKLKTKALLCGTIAVLLFLLTILIDIVHIREIHASEPVTIDVTSLATGEEISHDCNLYRQTMYDSGVHWDECILCNKELSPKESHSYSDYWTMGDSCSVDNKHVFSCHCGYSYEEGNYRPHNSNEIDFNSSYHIRRCDACNSYWYDNTKGKHYREDGSLILHGDGECAECGLWVSSRHEGQFQTDSKYSTTYDLHSGGGDPFGEENMFGWCFKCNEEIPCISNSIERSWQDDICTLRMTFTFPSYCDFETIYGDSFRESYPGCMEIKDQSEESWKDDNYLYVKKTVQIKVDRGVLDPGFYIFGFTLLSDRTDPWIFNVWTLVNPDAQAPVINSVNTVNLATYNDWTTQMRMDISGTENFCNSVDIIVKEDNGKIVYQGKADCQDGNWNASFFPAIEADESGKWFTIQVTDEAGNASSTQKFIRKTDMIPPTPVSVAQTDFGWSKTKTLTSVSTDYGARGVVYSFNNQSDNAFLSANRNGDVFSGDLIFTGDVYGSVVAALYLKDGVGNPSTQWLTIYNLDNTAPTITGVEKQMSSDRGYMVLNTSAHDINAALGASGSGVASYSVTTQAQYPGDWTGTFPSITGNGTYYVWAQDAVGNVSAPYEVVVTEFAAPVTYVDVIDSVNGTVLKSEGPFDRNIGSTVYGSDLNGGSTLEQAYYYGYYLDHVTSSVVTAEGATVYRVFKLCTVDVSGRIDWIDNSNRYSTRPDDVTLTLYRNGSTVSSQAGFTSSDANTFTFSSLPKYNIETGEEFSYSVSQGTVTSKKYPEDRYSSKKDGYVFTNTLQNYRGISVIGTIYWDDGGDRIGCRPDASTVYLYQIKDGIREKQNTIEVEAQDDRGYGFTGLQKYWYDSNGTPWAYTYDVEESIESMHVSESGISDSYAIQKGIPQQEGRINFTNSLSLPWNKKIILLKKWENEITIKTNTDKSILVQLEKTDTFIDKNLNVSYGDPNGDSIKTTANQTGTKIPNISSGKFMITINDPDYEVKSISLKDGSEVTIQKQDSKTYLVIPEANKDILDEMLITLEKKEVLYRENSSLSNYFAG